MDKPKKRIMRDFKLAEISSVDHPAQQGARARIMKRRDDDLTEEEVAALVAKTMESKHYEDAAREYGREVFRKALKQEQEEMTRMNDVLDAVKKQVEAIGNKVDALEKKQEDEAEEITEEQFDVTLASVAKAIRQSYRCSPHDAMQGARGFLTDPAAFEKLAPRILPVLQEDYRKSQPDSASFARKVLVTSGFINEYQKKKGTPLRKTVRQDALRRLRLENPEEFEAYQRGA